MRGVPARASVRNDAAAPIDVDLVVITVAVVLGSRASAILHGVGAAPNVSPDVQYINDCILEGRAGYELLYSVLQSPK